MERLHAAWADWSSQEDLFPLRDPALQARIVEFSPERVVIVVEPLEAAADGRARALVLLPGPLQAHAVLRQAQRSARSAEAVRLLPARDAVGFAFPWDPGLPGLAAAADPRALRILLHGIFAATAASSLDWSALLLQRRLAAWQPGRRALLGVHVRNGTRLVAAAALEVLPVDRAAAAVHSHQTLEARMQAGAIWRIPRLLAFLETKDLLVREWVDELPLAADRLGALELRRVAHSLAQLHAEPLALAHHRSPPEEAEAIRASAEALAGLLPPLAARLQRAAAAVAQAVVLLNLSPSSITFGGLALDQVAIDAQRVWWLRPGAVARGPAAMDLGALKAELDADRYDFLFREYAAAAEETPEPEWVAAAEVGCLWRALARPLCRFLPDAEARVTAALDRIEQRCQDLPA